MWIKQCILTFSGRKYRISSLPDAAKTVLGIFGFDNTLFGKVKDKRSWMELREIKIGEAGKR